MNFIELYKKLCHEFKDLKISYNVFGDYLFVDYEDEFVRFCFCEKTEESLECLSQKICIENVKCFDKWTKSPCSLSFPNNESEYKFLLFNILFWGTKDGYKISNEYNFEDYVFSYPKDFLEWEDAAYKIIALN